LEVERAFETAPTAAASEYGRDGTIEFRRDIESFISREVLEACIVPGRHELAPLQGVQYVGFVDPSGGSSDSFTLAIAHKEQRGDTFVHVIDARPREAPAIQPGTRWWVSSRRC